MDPAPLSVPAQRREYVVLTHLLAAITLPIAATVPGALAGSVVLAIAGLVLTLVGLGWSAVRAWNERVEFHPDRIVHRHGGRERVLPFDALDEVSLQWFDPRAAYGSQQQVSLVFTPREGAPVRVRGVWSELRAPFDGVLDALAARASARLRAGETLTFVDRPGFPLRATAAFGFFALLTAYSLLSLVDRGGHDAQRGLPQALALLAVTGIVLFRAVRTWREALHHGGLVVSAQGVQSLRDHVPARVDPVGYRTAAVDPRAWIPWDAIASLHQDGFQLSLAAPLLGRSIALSAATHNLAALGRLLHRERSRALPPDASAGVRVELAPPEDDGYDYRDDGSDARLDARSRRR